VLGAEPTLSAGLATMRREGMAAWLKAVPRETDAAHPNANASNGGGDQKSDHRSQRATSELIQDDSVSELRMLPTHRAPVPSLDASPQSAQGPGADQHAQGPQPNISRMKNSPPGVVAGGFSGLGNFRPCRWKAESSALW
jgi:hypothetical protein